MKSNAKSNGIGDISQSKVSAQHFKNADGLVGVNVSSVGNATGVGKTNSLSSIYGASGWTSLLLFY